MINPLWLSMLSPEARAEYARTPASIVTQAFNDQGIKGGLKAMFTPLMTPAARQAVAVPKPRGVLPLESQTVTLETPLPQSPEEVELGRAAAMQTPEVQATQGDLEAMQELAKMGTGIQPQVNLAPLTNLADTWYGGNISKGNVPQESQQELLQRLAGYQGAVAKQRGSLADMIEAYQKKVAPSGGRMLATTSLKDVQEMQRKNMGALTAQQQENLYKEIRQKSVMPMVQSLTDSGKQLQYIEQVLGRGDIKEIGSALSNFARIVAGEKGVLTQQDINRQLPDNWEKTKADVVAFFKSGGTYDDPRVLESIKSLTEMMKNATRKAYNEKIHAQVQTYQADPFIQKTGMNVEDAYGGAAQVLGTNFGPYESIANYETRQANEAKNPTPKPTARPTAAKAPKLTKEEQNAILLELQTEIKRRKAGGK